MFLLINFVNSCFCVYNFNSFIIALFQYFFCNILIDIYDYHMHRQPIVNSISEYRNREQLLKDSMESEHFLKA